MLRYDVRRQIIQHDVFLQPVRNIRMLSLARFRIIFILALA